MIKSLNYLGECMEFKDFLKLKEADETTSDETRASGVRSRRAGDSPFNDLPFNTTHHAKLINELTPKVAQFFKRVSSGTRAISQYKSAIKKLELDDQ